MNLGRLLLSFKLKIASFFKSGDYWDKRYRVGDNSGAGSYGKLAEFKAQVLNQFVERNNIQTVLEWGCGDGNQLKLSNYPSYIGFDISPKAIEICKSEFVGDKSKEFRLNDSFDQDIADLSLSLDVVYHLIEDDVFDDYMQKLFKSASRFVIIYSSNTNKQAMVQVPHVKHRKFTEWVSENQKHWELIEHIPNEYSIQKNKKEGSFADFYIFSKTGSH